MRFLYVSPHPPGPARSGGAQRSELLASALGRFGEVERWSFPSESSAGLSLDARALVLADGPCRPTRPGWLSPVRVWHQGSRWRWRPWSAFQSAIGDLGRFDLVVSRYLSTACMAGLFRHSRLLIDVDDYDPDRLRQRLRHASFWKRLTLRRCLRFSEQAHHTFLPRAAHCWVSNPADRRHPGLAVATLLPNIPYLPAGLPECSSPSISPPVLLFVGTLSYSANSDGLDAFLRQAWPAIIQARPDARLRVVGQGMSPRQRERWKTIQGVEPIGFLENLAEAYAGCRACVAPLLAGAGTNIKVLEAAAYGRACVVTPVAHRGFEETLPAPGACLRVESVADMSRLCVHLLDDAGLAAEVGQCAREAVRLHYTPTAFAAAVSWGCERVLAASFADQARERSRG